MMAEPFPRKDFRRMLQEQILPRVENTHAHLILAYPGVASKTTRVVPHAVPLLRTPRQGRSATHAGRWEEEGFNAGRYPTLIWVTEGEADFRLGITRRMVASNKSLSPRVGAYTVQMLADNFFLLPPGMPFSDGSRSHWERPNLAEAHSQLLWFHPMPAGVSLHICRTQGSVHTSTRSLFVDGGNFLPLVSSLFDELQSEQSHSSRLARHYMTAFLLHLDRALNQASKNLEEQGVMPVNQDSVTDLSSSVERACRYFENNLSQKITLDRVAAHVYVSPTHLNRLFHAQMGMTATEYLTRRRIEQARSLLESTNLPINRIAVLCGYPYPEHFSRTFRQYEKCSPVEFRRQARP